MGDPQITMVVYIDKWSNDLDDLGYRHDKIKTSIDMVILPDCWWLGLSDKASGWPETPRSPMVAVSALGAWHSFFEHVWKYGHIQQDRDSMFQREFQDPKVEVR